MINVYVNGEKRALADGCTVAGLLEEFKLQPMRVAVELNQQIVPKRLYASTALQAEDRVEIVTFVGGG